MAPDTPLVIIHNSGHKAYFNSAAAAEAGLTRDTPDPKGAKYGHDANGELDGTAEETGAVFSLLTGAIEPSDYPAMLHAELGRLNRVGLTTCSEMAFEPIFRPVLEQMHDELTVRLRVYEVSNAAMTTDATPVNGDDLFRQVGIKIWVDGSPWIGNIDLSFPYLDTDATRTIGVTPGSCGHANYTREQLTEIVHAYFPQGWPMACHVQGDAGVDTILDIYEEVLRKHPRDDHRLRLEHVGAITRRAAAARPRPRRHLQPLRRPDPLLGRRHRRRSVRPRARKPLDAMWFRGRHRHAHLAAQRPAGHAGGAAAQYQRRGHPHRTEWPGHRPGAAIDRRAGHPRADHRRGVAAVRRRRDRLAGGRQVCRHGGAVGRPAYCAAGEIADLEVRATFLAGKQVYGV